VVELQQLLGEGFQTGKTVLFSTMHNSIGCHLFHCIAKLTFGGPAGTSNALQYAHGVGRDFVCKDLANQFLSSVGFNRWIGNCPTQSAVVVNYLQSSNSSAPSSTPPAERVAFSSVCSCANESRDACDI